jgi:hypothetical protein
MASVVARAGLSLLLAAGVSLLPACGENDPVPPTHGTISGQVVSATDGLPIPDAEVRVVPEKATSCCTNAGGDFTIIGCPPGSYSLIAERPFFFDKSSTVKVDAGKTTKVTIQMSVSVDSSRFEFLDSYNDHEYYVSKTQEIWTDALTITQQNNGHLLTVADSTENARIGVTAALAKGEMWIGFTDTATEGYWRWVTGEPVTFTAWKSGEPNNSGGEDYAVILPTGQWNDLGALLRYFILEVE